MAHGPLGHGVGGGGRPKCATTSAYAAAVPGIATMPFRSLRISTGSSPGVTGRVVSWPVQVAVVGRKTRRSQVSPEASTKYSKAMPKRTSSVSTAVSRWYRRTAVVASSLPTAAGYDRATNQQAWRDRPIRTVAIPKWGKKSAARPRDEHRPAFRRAQRWRTGGEGTLSRLKRTHGLRWSRYRGHDRVTTGVGLGVFAHYLPQYNRRVAG